MTGGLGIREHLESLKELRDAQGCDEAFYRQYRSELLEELATRPTPTLRALLPNGIVTVYLLFMAFVFACLLYSQVTDSLATVIPLSVGGTLVFYLSMARAFRKDF